MRVFMPVIGLAGLLTFASAQGVSSFGPLLTWVLILGTLVTMVLLAFEEGA